MNGDARRRERRIRTPEGVSFAFDLASPVSRGIALALDLLVVGAISQVFGNLWQLLSPLAPDLFGALSILMLFAVSVLYWILLEWRWRGQTVGKRVMRLRVMDAQGFRLRADQVVLRNLMRAADALPLLYLAGAAFSQFHPLAQRLGDLVAGTVVVRVPRLREPDLEQVAPTKYNSLREHAWIAARLRQRFPPRDAALMLQAVLRRNELDDEARVRLFDDMAGRLRTDLSLPDDLLAGLSSEQIVRNAVDVLYRQTAGAGPGPG